MKKKETHDEKRERIRKDLTEKKEYVRVYHDKPVIPHKHLTTQQLRQCIDNTKTSPNHWVIIERSDGYGLPLFEGDKDRMYHVWHDNVHYAILIYLGSDE